MPVNEKITVLGFRGAGKTTYMAGMYDLLSYGLNRFFLHAAPDDDQYLSVIWEDISSGATRKWPMPSDDKRLYTFRLSYDLKEMLSFDWMDYPGGALIDPGYELIDDLKRQLGSSACLQLLINGESFTAEAKDDDAYKTAVSRKLKKNKDLKAARFLGELSDSLKGGLPPIVIVITKSDLIENKWIHLIDPIIKEEFAPVFGRSDQEERIVMVEAVSLGEGIEQGEDADPVAIELPVAFAVLCSLKRLIEERKAVIKAENGFIDKSRNWFTEWWDKESIEAAKSRKAEIEAVMSRLAGGVVHLLDLFDDDKMIYKNGAPVSLKNYFNIMLKDV